MGTGIDRGRDAFDRQAWRRAYEHLSSAALEEPLEVADLERLAAAAYLAGYGEESSDLWAQASSECARIGEVARAARCAFWLAFALLNGGELARGGGWIDRAQRLLDQRRLDCVEQGYLRYGAALRAVFSGDVGAALTGFHEAAGMGERYQDAELTALARIGEGRCLIYSDEVAAGVAMLDEAMVAVGANEVSAIATGDAYCTVIEGCHELFDVARAREWTAALSRWCDAQPELVLYRGQCLVHRAEILQLRGEWDEALEEVERALARLAEPASPRVLGAAAYVRAELHRLRGEFAPAEDAYRRAGEQGVPVVLAQYPTFGRGWGRSSGRCCPTGVAVRAGPTFADGLDCAPAAPGPAGARQIVRADRQRSRDKGWGGGISTYRSVAEHARPER